MPSFAEIANKKANTIEKPPLPPVGNYIAMIIAEPSITKRESANGDLEIVDFSFQGQQALDDVDPDELAKFGGVKGVRVRHSFIFNTNPDEEARFRQTEYELTRFLVDHLKAGKETDSISQLMGNAKGTMCQIEIGHRPDPKKADVFYANVKSTMPID